MFFRPSFALIFFLLAALPLHAQAENFGPCCMTSEWSQVTMSDEAWDGKGQAILVVTNRPYQADDPHGVVFPNKLAPFREVRYLHAVCREGNWTLHPAGDLTGGLESVHQERDMLLFVHGHGKSMPAVLARAKQIQEKYDLSLLVFDWPSYNSNFNKSLSRVRRCGENFYNLLLQLGTYREERMGEGQHLSMLLHSLGNYFLSHMVVNGNSQYMKEEIFDNIIMNAPAIRSKEHGEVLSRIRMQDRLYVLYNANDRVLKGAQLLTSGKMLGNLVMQPTAPNATYVDFTLVAGSEHTYFTGFHSFEYDLPVFPHFFQTVMNGRQVDFSDPGMFRQGDQPNMFVVR